MPKFSSRFVPPAAAAVVLPAPGFDQALGVSPLSARTCTWWDAPAVRLGIVALVPVPLCVCAVYEPVVPSRYCTP